MMSESKEPRYKVPKTWTKKKPEDLVYAPSRKPLEPELKDKLDLATYRLKADKPRVLYRLKQGKFVQQTK
jgi:hypothetical protein